MSISPYSPPVSSVADQTPHGGALYSPTQAACGAALGGPVAVAYFLWANFRALGKHAAAIRTIWLGVAGVLGVLVLVLVLPERFPSSPFTIAYVVVARQVATQMQMTKQAISASPVYRFHSNWRVLGLAVLCLAGSAVCLIGGAVAAEYFGLVA